MSRIIKRIVTMEPKRIGDLTENAFVIRKSRELLESKYSDVVIQVAPDGKQYLPLSEVCKFDDRVNREAEKGYKSGYSSGHDVGFNEGRAEAQKAFSALGKATRDCIDQRAALLQEAESHIIEIALKIARKLTFDAAKIDPQVTAGIVKGTIQSLVDKRNISVQVHPDHLQELEKLMDDFQSMSSDIRELSLEADPRVGHGGCFIRTPSGDIDARLESQFKIVEDTIQGETE